MSSGENADRLVRWLFDRHSRLVIKSIESNTNGGGGSCATVSTTNASSTTTSSSTPTPTSSLRSVVVAAASVSKPRRRSGGGDAGRLLRSAVDNAVRSNSSTGSSTRDARDIINARRHPESGRLVTMTTATATIEQRQQAEAENEPPGPINVHDMHASQQQPEPIVKKVRCPDFPSCPLTDDLCPNVHPKEPCKYFPNCMYGKECLFVHSPFPCRFGERCSNPFCNFTHPPPGSKPTAAVQALPIISPMSIPCRFGARCRRPDCQFLHPVGVPCPHGAGCLRPACPFTHPSEHPPPPPRSLVNRPCRFGSACAKADCPFQHPGRKAHDPLNVVSKVSVNGGGSSSKQMP